MVLFPIGSIFNTHTMPSRLLCFLFLASPLVLRAYIVMDPADNSKAGTDGPHVFYRDNGLVVKYVVMRDAVPVASTQCYADKRSALLHCTIPETGDTFSFSLQEKLEIQPDNYLPASRLLALSDIEGNFKAMKMMLQSAGVMDNHFNWTFGDGHLVLLGDFFDRGLQVTECLWLLYKLEGEADAAGGKLHFILGNHEVMNLQGNTEYVRKKYLQNARILQEDYHRWFDQNAELGRWLRTKNAVEKIGDIVFCHGGISMDLVHTGLSLFDINRIARHNLGKDDYYIELPMAKTIFDHKTGIFWYRGLAKNMVSQEEVTTILDFVGAKKMVVGHTLQPFPTAYYHGRVICIDLYHEESLREGFVQTLWIEDEKFFTIHTNGEKSQVFSVPKPRNTVKPSQR